MAAKKKKPGKLPTAVIFWLIFFIGVTGVFLFNRETIQKNFNLLSQRLKLPAAAAPEQDKPAEPETAPVTRQAQPSSASQPPSVQQPLSTPQTGARVADKPASQTTTPAQTPPASQSASASQSGATAVDKPAAAKPQSATQQPSSAQQPTSKPAETRERSIYFTQVDKDGQILRSKVTRKLTVSDSPMLDALNALLVGPNSGEKNRGLVSLIPQNTRILSAVVRGTTAYISFSEDFQYNTYGVEGYAAQLNQIVWTVTEFPNIKDVQILVEGKRIDYLGEGIWIGSPIGRDG